MYGYCILTLLSVKCALTVDEGEKKIESILTQKIEGTYV